MLCLDSMVEHGKFGSHLKGIHSTIFLSNSMDVNKLENGAPCRGSFQFTTHKAVHVRKGVSCWSEDSKGVNKRMKKVMNTCSMFTSSGFAPPFVLQVNASKEDKGVILLQYGPMLKKSASAKSRQGSRIQLLGNIGEKIGKNRQKSANIKKYKIHSFFFQKFIHLKQQ